jgi:hypothetical protein
MSRYPAMRVVTAATDRQGARGCSLHPKDLLLATSVADIRRAAAERKIAALMGMEGGHMIDEGHHQDSWRQPTASHGPSGSGEWTLIRLRSDGGLNNTYRS